MMEIDKEAVAPYLSFISMRTITSSDEDKSGSPIDEK